MTMGAKQKQSILSSSVITLWKITPTRIHACEFRCVGINVTRVQVGSSNRATISSTSGTVFFTVRLQEEEAK